MCDAARASQQADKFPTTVMTAWWLATDVPFIWNEKYKCYMPTVPEDQFCYHLWQWPLEFVEKVKEDLKAISTWDR